MFFLRMITSSNREKKKTNKPLKQPSQYYQKLQEGLRNHFMQIDEKWSNIL